MEVTGLPPGKLAEFLMSRYKIFTVPIEHPEFRGLRITPNVFTTIPELDRFCSVMGDIARGRTSLPA